MWLTDLVKRVFGIDRKKLANVIGDVQISNKMGNALDLWTDIFYNNPPWKEHSIQLTKTAKTATAYMATLATSEILINTGTSERAAFVKGQIMQYALRNIRKSVQLAGVGGRVALKPYVYGGNIYCDRVPANCFFPTRVQGDVVEACFFADAEKVNGKEYIRIESHDWQKGNVQITNRVYLSSSVGKGRELPLSTVPSWADLQDEITLFDVPHPLYACLSMPFSNSIDEGSDMPVSLYADAVDTLRQLDRIYNDFLYEVYTGKRRQIVDIAAIKSNDKLPGGKAVAELYIKLIKQNDAKPFEDYTPKIRVDEYQKALNIQLRLFENQCGFSPQTFSFDIKTGRAMTATEVISEDKNTYNTIKAIQEDGMKQGLLDLIHIYDYYASLFRLAPVGKVEAGVDFGDSIFEDTGIEYTRRKSMVDSRVLRPEKLLSWYFGISEEEAVEGYLPADTTPDDLLFGR